MSDLVTQLSRQLGQSLQQQGLRVATAESCTGGGVAAAITLTPGSSTWFECGIVSYSNRIKSQLLNVDTKTLQQYGAVSDVVVSEMLQGVLVLSGVDVAVAISGIAGPDGGSAEKPVGTVWFAWGKKEQTPIVEKKYFAGDRHQVQRKSVIYALEGLIKLVKPKL